MIISPTNQRFYNVIMKLWQALWLEIPEFVSSPCGNLKWMQPISIFLSNLATPLWLVTVWHHFYSISWQPVWAVRRRANCNAFMWQWQLLLFINSIFWYLFMFILVAKLSFKMIPSIFKCLVHLAIICEELGYSRVVFGTATP